MNSVDTTRLESFRQLRKEILCVSNATFDCGH